MPDMPISKSSAAIGVANTTILIAGGYDGQLHSTTVISYDSVTAEWSTISPMTFPRTGARGAVADNMFLVVGGWHRQEPQPSDSPDFEEDLREATNCWLGSTERLDLASGEWSTVGSIRRIEASVVPILSIGDVEGCRSERARGGSTVSQ